jgi:uncharacterized protein (TIGR02444 family)
MTSESAFWTFSLGFYARPGVAETCLRLQDETGVDVNVMLYLLFLAANGRRIDAAAIERIDAASGEWREAIVRPLRGVRRRLRSSLGPFDTALTAALRSEVKRIELESERLQQTMLEHLMTPAALNASEGEPRSSARHHLERYADLLGVAPGGDFERILDAFGASLQS